MKTGYWTEFLSESSGCWGRDKSVKDGTANICRVLLCVCVCGGGSPEAT